MLVLAYFLLQIPSVQTYLATKAAGYLQDKIGTRVDIKGVDISFFDTVVLEGVYIEDQKKDTLLYAGKLFVQIRDFSIGNGYFDLKKVTLLNARVGLRKYTDENGLNFQYIIDAFKSKDKKKSTTKPVLLFCENISIVNNDFSYQIMGKAPPAWGFDAANIFAKGVSGDFTGLIMHGDTIDANIGKLFATEKSGLQLKSMNCQFRLSSHEMLFDKLAMQSNNSTINGRVQFGFNSLRAFAYPFDSIRVNINLVNTNLQVGDIAYFAPMLRGADIKAALDGHFTGTFRKLKGKGVTINYGKSTKFYGNLTVKGLPNAAETFIDADIKQLVTTPNDIATLRIPPYDKKVYIDLPPEVYRLGTVTFKGTYKGFFTDFVADGRFTTALGAATTDLQLWQVEGQKELAYSGSVKTENFKLGDLLPGQKLGIVTLNADVEGQGFDLKAVNTTLKGHITAFDYNDYRYQNVDFDGQLVNSKFTGGIDSHDPNMELAFDGTMSLDKKIPEYNFDVKVVRADLSALHFVDLDSTLVVTAKLSSNITGNTIETLNGDIVATDVTLDYGTTTYPVGTVTVYSDIKTYPKQLRLVSDIADVNIIGKYEIATLPKSVIRTINTFIPSYYMVGQGAKSDTIKTQDFNFTADIKNTDALTAIFLPDLKVTPGSKFHGDYKSTSDQLTLIGNVPMVEYSGVKMKEVDINSNTKGRTLYFNSTFERVEPIDSLYLDNVTVNMSTRNDSIYTHVDFENTIEDTIHNTGAIDAVARLYDKDKIRITLTKTEIDAFDYKWIINPDNLITIEGNNIDVNKLVFETGGQSFRAFGRLSNNPDDQLNILFAKFNMANANRFIPDNIITLRGLISGSVSISNVFKEPFFRSNLKVNDMYVNDTEFGSGSIISEWDKSKKVINVHSLISKGTTKTLSIDGQYYLTKKTDNLDFDVVLNKIRLAAVNPYTKGTVTFLGTGTVTAGLKITGDFKKPHIGGDVSIVKANALIDYLNTTYSFTHDFKLTENKIPIDDLLLSDNDGHTATLNGEVTHKQFDNWAYNVGIRANNFRCLNTTESQNSLYYGKAYVTGTIDINGNLKKTYINVDARTNAGTKFHIPLSSPNSASSSDFINFIDRDSTGKEIIVVKPKKPSMGIVLDMDLEVTPDAEVQIIFDKQVGDIITGSGSGDLHLNIDTKGEFVMNGLYTIERGKYLFTLKNLLNKELKVEKGGTIEWKRSPYDAKVDITALYDLKASVLPLLGAAVSDELAAYKRKIPIQCRLGMKGNLLAPELSFTIATPTNDDRARNAIASVQSNQEELNKQFFSLLLLNTFLPPSQGGLVASQGATAQAGLNNNGFELLSSQLNVFLSKISDDFDINVNYRPGENGQGPQAEIGGSVSVTDYITIDASVAYGGGNTTTNTTGAPASTTASNIVSDFNMEVRASQDGRLKFKVFNRSNQNMYFTTDAPYTQGIGVAYRQEFNSFRDLILGKKKQEAPKTPPTPTLPTPPAVTPTPPDTSKTK